MIAPWVRDVGQRITVLWWLKGIGTTAFMTLFFWAYFTILEHPARPAVEVPALAIDHWIPLTPWAYGIYISLWVYVSLPPALMRDLRTLLHFGAWVAAMCGVCLVFFWQFPTQTPTFGTDWSVYPGLSLIKGVDAPGNACPSLHVGSAVFAAFWLQRILGAINAPRWLRWLNPAYCVAIAWSTIATMQHVTIDVIAGALVGAGFAWASLVTADRSAKPKVV
jgi:hypothetical protein